MTNEVASDSDENHIENIPVVREYPEVFLEEPSGVPPTRQVEIRSDLTLVAYPIVKALYQLVPFTVQEISNQLQELVDKEFIRYS